MSELKPCPFCGGEPIEYVRRDFAYIGCVKCCVVMQEGESKQELIERWNGRNTMEIQKLEKLLKKAEIPHFMINRMGGYQIFYPDIPDKVCTVTQGKKDEKLKIEGLETQKEKVVRCLIGEAVRLTASEAYRRIREHYEGKNERKSKKFTGYHK